MRTREISWEEKGKRRERLMMMMGANSSFLTLLHPERKEGYPRYEIESIKDCFFIMKDDRDFRIIRLTFIFLFLLLGTLLPSLFTHFHDRPTLNFFHWKQDLFLLNEIQQSWWWIMQHIIILKLFNWLMLIRSQLTRNYQVKWKIFSRFVY